eukprot:gene33644-41509_t
MNLLVDMLSQTETAAQRIRDKHVVMLLGSSGAGKSGTIHFLAGSTMAKTKVGKMTHIAPVAVKYEELNMFITSPFPRSETRTIRDVTIQHTRAGAIESESVTLCDTPGFGDTDGVEIDIANGMGVVKALKVCRSVKPLVVMSKSILSDRMEGVAKMSQILLMLIPTLAEQLHTISYAYTKYHVDEEDEVSAQLDAMIHNPPPDKSSDTGFMSLLTDMAAKAEDHAHVIHLLSDTSQELMDSLLSTAAIEQPASVFSYFVAPESFDRLRDQLNKHQLSVHRAVHRFDVPLLSMKMDELSVLKDSLAFSECVSVYDDCVRQVSQCINTLVETMTSRLDAMLRDQNTAVPEDIAHAVSVMNKLSALEPVRARHCPEMSNLEELACLKLHGAQQSLFRGVKAYNLSASCPVSVESVAGCLSKMRTIAELIVSSLGAREGFKELATDCQQMYRDGCDQLCGLVRQSQGVALRAIKDSNWAVFVAEMDRLKKMVESLGAHLEPAQLSDVYRAIQERVAAVWEAAVESVISIVTSRNIEVGDVRVIDSVLVMLRSVTRHDGVDQHVQEGLSAQCVGKVVDSVSAHIVHVCDGLVGSASDFQLIHERVQLIDALRKIPELLLSTEIAYKELLAALRSRIGGLREVLLIALTTLSADPATDAFDPRQFTDRFLELQKASCFENHPSGVFTTELEAVQEALIVFHSNLMQEMHNPLAVEQRDKLTSRYECLQAIGKLSGCYSVAPALEGMFKLMRKSFMSKVRAILVESVSVFSASPLVWKDIESVLLFLMRCQDLDMKAVETEASALALRVRQFSVEHFSAIQQVWSENFQCFSSTIVREPAVLAACAAKLRAVCLTLREMWQMYKPAKIKNFTGEFDFYTDLFHTLPDKMQSSMGLRSVAVRLEASAAVRHDMCKDSLFDHLQVCNALKGLDQFTSAETPKFTEMAAKFEAAIATIKKTAAQSIQLAVRTGKYTDAVRSMADFEVASEADDSLKRDICREMAEALRVTVGELEEDVKQDNKFETIGSFCVFLETLQRVKDNMQVVIHLLDAGPQQRLPDRLAKIEQSVVQWVSTRLNSLLLRISKNEFHHCEDIQSCLAESLKGEIQVKLGAAKRSIAQTRATLRQRVSDVAEFFVKLPLTSYSKNPPAALFKELDLCVDDDRQYAITAGVVAGKINQSVRSLLEAVRTADMDVCDAQIKLVESCCKFLPLHVAAMFEDYLQEFKTELEKMNESMNRQLEEDIALGNFRLMVQRSVDYINDSMFCRSDKYRAEIRKSMAAGSSRFQGDLFSGNLLSVLQNFPDMF